MEKFFEQYKTGSINEKGDTLWEKSTRGVMDVLRDL